MGEQNVEVGLEARETPPKLTNVNSSAMPKASSPRMNPESHILCLPFLHQEDPYVMLKKNAKSSLKAMTAYEGYCVELAAETATCGIFLPSWDHSDGKYGAQTWHKGLEWHGGRACLGSKSHRVGN